MPAFHGTSGTTGPFHQSHATLPGLIHDVSPISSGSARFVRIVDSTSSPLNYLLALVTLDKNGYQYATLHKVVNGVLTTLITNTYAAFVAGAYLEVRCDGNTISLWYNNVQVGANQTVNDAGILNNKIHGVFSTDGGNKLNRFFVGYA